MLLAACSTLEEADPTGVLSEPEQARPEQVSPPANAGQGAYPNLATVPEEPTRTPSRQAERRALQRSLAADRANASYSNEPLRAEGMSTAPLSPAVAAAIAAGPDAPPDPSMPATADVDLSARPGRAAAALAREAPADAPRIPVLVEGNAEVDPDRPPPDPATEDLRAPTSAPAEPVLVEGGAEVDPDAPPAGASAGTGSPATAPSAPPAEPVRTARAATADAAPAAAPEASNELAAPGAAPDATAPEPAAPDAAAGDSADSSETGQETKQETRQETQTAALPPAAETPAWTVELAFEPGAGELSPQARETLTGLAERLQAEPDTRVEIRAYAEQTEDAGSRARRLSLNRALEVRAFLTRQGIRSTRMDIRALGDTGTTGPLNRVEIGPAQR